MQIWGYGYHLLSSVTTKTHSSSESISAAVLSSPTRVPGTHHCQHSHTRFIPVSPCQVRVIVLMECHSLNANIQCDLVWFITLWWMHKVCVCQTGRKETAAGVIVYCHAAYFSYFFPSLLPPSQPLFSTSFFRLSLFPVSYAAKNIVCVFCSRMGCWPSPVIFILVCYWGTRRAKVAVCSAYVFTFSVIHNHSVFFVVVSFRSQFAHILSKESVTLCMKLSNKPVINIYIDVKLSTSIRHRLASAFAAVSLFHPLYFQ